MNKFCHGWATRLQRIRCRMGNWRLTGQFVGIAIVGSTGAITAFPTFTPAQVVADPSIGTTVEPFTAQIDLIKNGARSANGANLFHSFEEFNIGQNRGAYFIVPDANVLNILARVTGGNPSQVLGILGTRQQLANGTFLTTNANLFLMNPNGIIFGQGAQLDIGGSFVATTANAIQFGDRGFFSATNPEAPSSLLTVNPSAFLFNQANAAPIENRSTAPALRGLASFFNLRGLEVAEGRSIVLLGGNVTVNGGGVLALGGRVELAGLAGVGVVGLDANTETLRLSLPDNVARADVALKNGAGITAAGQGGGDVALYARNIEVLQGSFIEAGIIPNAVASRPSGNIVLDAGGSATIDDSSVYNGVFSGATGNAGRINIVAGSLSLTNRGQITANVSPGSKGNSGVITVTARDKVSILGGGKIISSVLSSGKGNSGGVNITANGAVLLDGQERDFSATTFFPSAIFSRVERNGEGNAGNVTIKANSLSVTNRAQIASTTAGQGNAGNIILNIDEQTFLLNSLILSEVTERSGVGNGGDINLTTDSLILRNGAGLLADTENRGNAGNIFITARGDVLLDGTGPSAGNLNQTVSSQISTSVESDAVGQGGKIEIAANSLSVLDRGFISSSTWWAIALIAIPACTPSPKPAAETPGSPPQQAMLRISVLPGSGLNLCVEMRNFASLQDFGLSNNRFEN